MYPRHTAKEHPAAADAYSLRKHRHLLRLDGLLRTYGRRVAASHQSAVLAWGLPTDHESLDLVHLVHTKRGRTARRFDTFRIHTCELDGVVVRHERRQVTAVSLAVVGNAMNVGVGPGVETIDAALTRGLTSKADLTTMLARMRHTPRLGLARRAVSLADGLAESPGETRLRLILVELGIRFIAQHWIRIGKTSDHYRVDFYLPDLGVVLEYDGQVKYGNVNGQGRAAPGESAAQAVRAGREELAREKSREDDLRLEGFGVGRLTAGLLSPAWVSAVIKQARAQAQPRALRRPAQPPAWAEKR